MKTCFRLLLLMLCTTSAFAAVPGSINYQGRLLNDGIPVGFPTPVTATMVVSIWSAASGGTKVYEETHSSVSVDDGVYNFQIGSGTPTAGFNWNPASLFSTSTRYLELTITIAPNPAETLSPRQPLLSAPYTIRSGNADNADNSDRLGGQFPSYYGTAAADADLYSQIDSLRNNLKSICENGNGIWDGTTCLKTIAVLHDKEKDEYIPISQLLKRWTESEVELECTEPHFHGYPDNQKPGDIMPVKSCIGTLITQEPITGCAFGKESEVIYYDLSKCEAFIPPPPPKD